MACFTPRLQYCVSQIVADHGSRSFARGADVITSLLSLPPVAKWLPFCATYRLPLLLLQNSLSPITIRGSPNNLKKIQIAAHEFCCSPEGDNGDFKCWFLWGGSFKFTTSLNYWWPTIRTDRHLEIGVASLRCYRTAVSWVRTHVAVN